MSEQDRNDPDNMGHDNFDQFRNEIEAAERRVAGEIDPGARAFVVAILVFVLLLTFILPHTGGARGWDVLFGGEAAGEAGVALPSRLFGWFTLVFAIGFSMLALLTRRWVLAWVALAGSAVACVFGMLAVWSRQTAPEPYPGPGIGLIIAWIAMIVLTFHWLRAVWARTDMQMAAEQTRRQRAAERQQKGLLDDFDGDRDTDGGRDTNGGRRDERER